MNDRARRREAKTLKQELPYPYDQDLSQILRNLNRRTPFGRRRQANDPVTAAYLFAAAQLIQRHLGPGVSRSPADPEDPDEIERPLLSFLSQRAVAAEVDHNPPPFHRVGVLRFGLWAWHYPAAHQDEAADALEEAISGPDPVRGIHRLCYWDMTRLLRTPMFRLGLVAAAQAEGDALVREAISVRHQTNTPHWKRFYQEFLQAHGLCLRPGISLDECADLLAAVADGVAVRALADPQARVVDHAQRRSLLGTAALALIAGCVVRESQADATPLEHVVRDMAGKVPVAPGARTA